MQSPSDSENEVSEKKVTRPGRGAAKSNCIYYHPFMNALIMCPVTVHVNSIRKGCHLESTWG
ncbi:hypothetical protein NQ317_012299 [Molorchus minor]|uniref:Uncharacterized protein n=1 Tax=Molorchus minor TaxID=1323400 RepID=A0ABQ9J1Z3_9CUCU|nr:hypothetical protein NQ317_012299 [Molorchus minor]